MKKTLVIGSTVLDMVIQIDHLPKTSEDIHIQHQKMVLGGCAYNAANILKKFNIDHTLLSPVGTGRNAMIVESLMQENNIKSSIKIHDADNGFCLCMVEKDGERTFVVYHGVEYSFSKRWIPKEDIDCYDSVYIAGFEIEEKDGNEIIEFIEENPQLLVYFAPGPRLTSIGLEKLQRIFNRKPIVHLNEEEAITLADLLNKDYCGEGIDGNTSDDTFGHALMDFKNAASVIQQATDNIVIITLGSKGAYYLEQGQGVLVEGREATVVDTIGAGDSHIGAIMATRKLGYSIYDSVRCANHISAAVVEVSGSSLTELEFKEALTLYKM